MLVHQVPFPISCAFAVPCPVLTPAEPQQLVGADGALQAGTCVDVCPADVGENVNEVAVGLSNGQVVVLRFGNRGEHVETVASWEGRASKKAGRPVTSLKFSPDGGSLAVGGSGGGLDVLNAQEEYKWVAEAKGHAGAVTHMDWSEDGEYLQSNDAALRVLFWRKFRPSFRLQDKPIVLSKHRWQSFTCTLGWPTMGVFQPGREGHGVNSVDRASDKSVMLLADVSGNVALTAYPTLHRDVARKEYHAHSSPLASARFSASGSLTLLRVRGA